MTIYSLFVLIISLIDSDRMFLYFASVCLSCFFFFKLHGSNLQIKKKIKLEGSLIVLYSCTMQVWCIVFIMVEVLGVGPGEKGLISW